MDNSRKFYSKTMLFGEYALMFGSPALSMPFEKRFGYFEFSTSHGAAAKQSNSDLLAFLPHVERLNQQHLLSIDINVKRFESEINKGLVFRSNIPIGYGLGSSGALVAAVYHRYGIATNSNRNYAEEDLSTLKEDFAQMESYFHGTSSGLDPLICYLQKAVLLNAERKIKVVELPAFSSTGKGGIFMIDSGSPGKTQPLVDYFMKQSKRADFMEMIQKELIPLNQKCIRYFLTARWDELLPAVKKLSALSLQHFVPMIPENLKALWNSGLENEDYFLKLCGSGGGGMLLGFTSDLSKASSLLKAYSFSIVHRF